ncbi:UbiA prenyltransferase family-domain-containing protein [Hysterangium stoloniferum]|nr:UbiA prenyltransferase family-domain-containing protein [Hysterangium stoloniferum]
MEIPISSYSALPAALFGLHRVLPWHLPHSPIILPCPPRELLAAVRTLYLFTKSDFKTILLPVTVFASIIAPINRLARLSQVLIWIWLHLLQFCISNQTNCPEEDAVNKPWRPIPAGRITVTDARILYYCVVVACLLFSFERGVLPASILICVTTMAYNYGGLHRRVILRNACNAVGYASFELGATQLAGNRAIRSSGLIAILASSLIVFTTIHAADFRDEKGDRLEGKITIPIAFPEASRIGMPLSLTLWSTTLGLIWNVDYVLASILLAVGSIVGLRFFLLRNPSADRTSYLLFNVCIAAAIYSHTL